MLGSASRSRMPAACTRTTTSPNWGCWAHWVRLQKHPEQVVTYNVGRNINYTNVCLGQMRLLRLLPAAGFQRGLRPAQ